MIFEETRGMLKAFGLPLGDRNDLPNSTKKFADGGDFKIEVPTINSIEVMSALLDESNRVSVRINRITETFGMFRHTKTEIKQMVELCKQYGCELMMSTGPRAAYDTSATASTAEGRTIAYRLRGQEQLIRAIEDIKRGIDIGVSAFVIYDEGLLWLLTQMRTSGILPDSIKFKVSAHCGHGNPAAFKMLENLGADSINAVRDLQLPMIAALREAIDVPIDCHTDNPIASGGFIRVYEAPEIVRIAAPVYLKTGNSAVLAHGSMPGRKEGLRMANQAAIVLEMLERYMPKAKQSLS